MTSPTLTQTWMFPMVSPENDQKMVGKLHIYDLQAPSGDVLVQDLDFYDLGGDLTWLPPNDTERLNAYLVYLAEGAGLGAWLELFMFFMSSDWKDDCFFSFRAYNLGTGVPTLPPKYPTFLMVIYHVHSFSRLKWHEIGILWYIKWYILWR